MRYWTVGSGVMCAVLFMVGIHNSISASVGGVCAVLAVASGIVFVGLLEGA